MNLGDILIEGDDILGDGVNVAARLEGIAEPGGICISSSAYDQVLGKVAVEFADLGEHNLKNIARPVRVYTVILNGSAPVTEAAAILSSPLAPRLSIVVLPFDNVGGDTEQDYSSTVSLEALPPTYRAFLALSLSRAIPPSPLRISRRTRGWSAANSVCAT